MRKPYRYGVLLFLTGLIALPCVSADAASRHTFDRAAQPATAPRQSQAGPATAKQGDAIPSAGPQYPRGTLTAACALILGTGLVMLAVSYLRQHHDAEKALRNSEERFRSIVQFSPMGVVLLQLEGDRLLLTEANAAAKTLLKTDLDRFIGRPFEEAFPHWIHSLATAPFRKICTLGTPWAFHPIDNGDAMLKGSFEIHAFQTAPGKMACFFQDVSENLRSHQTLKNALNNAHNARLQLETVLKSVSDGLVFTDRDSRVLLMSHSAEELLGCSLGAAYKQPVSQIISDDHFLASLQKIAVGEQSEASVEMTLPALNSGLTRTVQARLAAVPKKTGLNPGTITLLRDISRERELDRLKTEFLSTAAHELRTPLTSVIGFAELLLKQGGLGEQQTEFLTIIYKKAEVLGKIVDDLLDLARVDTGQVIRLNKAVADVVSILKRSVCDYRQVCKDHAFKTVLPDEPVCLSVDDRKLFQVMENLLSNAVKFSPAGSQIQVTCQPTETEVFIAVSDQGIGMNAEQIRHMFDKFYRVDASNTAHEGLGLGMAIVKSIVEGHQGRIWVTSRLQRGTTVTFTLPR